MHSKLLKLVLITSALVGGTAVQAQEVYANFGFPVVGVGYALKLSPSLGLRGDIGTIGSLSTTRTDGNINYDAKLKYNRLGLYGDWFPTEGGFRVSLGLNLTDGRLDMVGKPTATSTININGTNYTIGAGDYYKVQAKYPKVMPYLGVGYGHHDTQPGWGFVADLGASFGKPSITTDTNLVATGVVPQSQVDAETNKVRDKANQLSVLPQLTLGVSYRF